MFAGSGILGRDALAGWALYMQLLDTTALAAVPSGTLIERYLEYAYRVSPAPWSYHLGSIIGALSVLCPDSAYIPLGAKRFQPNMWIWLIGKSGSRKTTAVAEIHGLLRKLFPARDPENLFPNADSVEMFMECLRARDGIRTLRVEFEMGNFLARTDPRSRLGAMRAVMTEVYDGNEMTRAILQQEEMLVIEKPRLSFLGAGTPAHLDEHVRAIDFQGGFVSRFALLLGHGGSYEFQQVLFRSSEPWV